jgi:DNA-binding HxlR family transcriptional regulator
VSGEGWKLAVTAPFYEEREHRCSGGVGWQLLAAEQPAHHRPMTPPNHISLIFKLTCGSLGAMTLPSAVPLAELPGRPCPIAATLEIVGERWALLVVREIALGATHFTDIVRGTGAPRDRIAARLKALEAVGVLTRTPYQSTPPRFEYVLTESGRALIPVLDALRAWGAVYAVSADDPDRQPHYPPLSKLKEPR